MKKIMAVTIMLFSASVCQAWKVHQEFHGVLFVKWSYNGSGIRTDALRDEIIAANVAFGSNTVNVGSFVNIMPSADEIALTTSSIAGTWDGQALWGAGVTAKEIRLLLSDKEYLKNRILEETAEVMVFKEAKKLTGIDFDKKKDKSESKMELLKRKYNDLP